MQRVVAIGICLAVLSSAPVRADLQVGSRAPEIDAKAWLNVEDGLKLSELRGLVVVLFFWVPYHEGGQRTLEMINSIDTGRMVGRRDGVVVIGLTEGDATRTEPVLRKEKSFFPVGLESDSKDDYRIRSFPRAVIIDPQGRVVWTGWPPKEGGQEFVNKLRAVLADTPPRRTHPLEVGKVYDALDRARAALRSEQFRDAFEAAREALETAVTGDPLKSTCQELLDLLEALGGDKLATVDGLIEQAKFDEAVRIIRAVTDEFRGLDVSKRARGRLVALAREFDQIGALVESQESAKQARDALIRAQNSLRNRKFGQACKMLERIIAEYPGSDEAGRAARIKTRMEANEKVMAYVRDHKASRDCKAWLANGRSFAKAGRRTEARRLFRKILDKYPNTSYADVATQELARLR